MDIAPYVETLRRDLLAAAEGAGEDARQVAERLGFALAPAVRLALMEAISHAAAEITAEMIVSAARTVDVDMGRAFRLRSSARIGPPGRVPDRDAGQTDRESWRRRDAISVLT